MTYLFARLILMEYSWALVLVWLDEIIRKPFECFNEDLPKLALVSSTVSWSLLLIFDFLSDKQKRQDYKQTRGRKCSRKRGDRMIWAPK